MELILVRHAQPDWVSPDGRNRNDPGLTALGHGQAALVARRLADTEDAPGRGDVDHLYASHAARAQQTAAPIAEALDLPIDTREDLVELRSPDHWDGVAIEVVRDAFESMRAGDREAWRTGFPGGEDFATFHARVTGAIDALLAEHGIVPAEEPGLWVVPEGAPDRILIVAHGGTNSTLVAHLLGVPSEPWEWLRFTMGHASVAVLAADAIAGANLWSLRALGDANHLPLDQRTA
ncbi:MAG: histidine phosphatase family protein [Acidimicrobiales bacterium]